MELLLNVGGHKLRVRKANYGLRWGEVGWVKCDGKKIPASLAGDRNSSYEFVLAEDSGGHVRLPKNGQRAVHYLIRLDLRNSPTFDMVWVNVWRNDQLMFHGEGAETKYSAKGAVYVDNHVVEVQAHHVGAGSAEEFVVWWDKQRQITTQDGAVRIKAGSGEWEYRVVPRVNHQSAEGGFAVYREKELIAKYLG